MADQLALLADVGANAVYVPHHSLDKIPLDALRRQGIRVYVDRTIFAGADLRQQYPDSAPIDAEGNVFDREGWYVPACPNHPQIRRAHLEAISRLLDQRGTEIDGLWLDFIRYPVRWEGDQPRLPQTCFCKHCLNLFHNADRTAYSAEETRTQAQTILHERRDEWVDWKCERIADFVQAVRAEIGARDLSIPLGIFSLPWRRADFDGAIRTVAGQDLQRLAASVDTFSPMVYHALCARPASWVRDVIDEVRAWTARPVLPIVQSIGRPDPLPAPELDAALAAAMDTPATGVMIFTLDPVREDSDKRAVVRERFGAVH